jgi:hypothetical protein
MAESTGVEPVSLLKLEIVQELITQSGWTES